MRRILVTGGAGFIGSALVRALVEREYHVATVDKLTYASDAAALDSLRNRPNHELHVADIADASRMRRIIRDFDPDAIMNLAAESHVDRSIDDPFAFVETNVRGTAVLLHAATEHWRGLPADRKQAFRFLQISTDEVFGSLGGEGVFSEDTRYAPNSPYAASKASADHFARAWRTTYGLPTIVTNCSNNYGPRQHAEKLIPTVLRYALDGQPIPIYGTGQNVRDWLYVEDHVEGLILAMESGEPGRTYLFGGEAETTNIDLAGLLCDLLDQRRARGDGARYRDQITFVTDRPGHDLRYAVDFSATSRRLSWRPGVSLAEGLARTVDWYLANSRSLVPPSQLGRIGLAEPVSGV